MDLKQGVGGVECIHLLQNEEQGRAVVNAAMNFPVAHETGSYYILWSYRKFGKVQAISGCLRSQVHLVND